MRKNKYFTAITMAAAIASMTAMTAVNYQAEEQTEAVSNTNEASKTEENRPENVPDQNMDMSSLELPEGFKPFDEEHVPDGKNAPEKGELKPIEFDENGNMIYGQKPEGMPEGDRPGQMPSMGGGRPGQMPQGNNGGESAETGETSQAPGNSQASGNSQAPENGQMPSMS